MKKTIERALFAAESDTRRRKSAPTLRSIESQLMKSILAQSLALEIIRNSQKPTSELLSELLEVEVRVGEFVGDALREAAIQNKNKIDVRGALAGALSFVPFAPPSRQRPPGLPWRKVALTWITKVLEEPSKGIAPAVPQSPLTQVGLFSPAPSSSLSSNTSGKSARRRKITSPLPKKMGNKSRRAKSTS